MNIQGLIPAISAPVMGNMAGTAATIGTNGSSTSSDPGNGLSAGNLQSTFLNLLVTELQNQDPTQPVDPTEMVSQMVSLNQLDQLISINQTLTSMRGSSAGSSGSARADGKGIATPISSTHGSAAALATRTASSALPLLGPLTAGSVPGGLMNLYGTLVGPKSSNFAVSGGK